MEGRASLGESPIFPNNSLLFVRKGRATIDSGKTLGVPGEGWKARTQGCIGTGRTRREEVDMEEQVVALLKMTAIIILRTVVVFVECLPHARLCWARAHAYLVSASRAGRQDSIPLTYK